MGVVQAFDCTGDGAPAQQKGCGPGLQRRLCRALGRGPTAIRQRDGGRADGLARGRAVRWARQRSKQGPGTCGRAHQVACCGLR